MSYRALVIGATGLVGKAVVEALLNEPNCSQIITLARRELELESDKLIQHKVDFETLENDADKFSADVMFCCLGTTKSRAGSIAAQRRVDLDYQLMAAKLANKMGAKHLLLVSSSGADAKSSNDYLKMKGELEVALEGLHFERLTIVQPSLLLGKRDHFRFAETLGAWILPMVCKLSFLKRYRPIRGEQVAKRLVKLAREQASGVYRYRLDEVFPVAEKNEFK